MVQNHRVKTQQRLLKLHLKQVLWVQPEVTDGSVASRGKGNLFP